MTKNNKRRKYIFIILGILLTYIVFVIVYRHTRWNPLLDAVDGDYIKVGDYTVNAYQAAFPSINGNLHVSHYIKTDMNTGQILTYDYADATIYPKLFGYDFSIVVCYRYENQSGSHEVRYCKMELDENMNYIDGEYGSKQIYEEYFEAIKETYQVIDDVWGIVDVKERL